MILYYQLSIENDGIETDKDVLVNVLVNVPVKLKE